jgi:HD superfamily phosphohydrolase
MEARKGVLPQKADAQGTLGTQISPDNVVRDLRLLEHYKVIQNRVWEEVWITELEAHLMDTIEFQRLHWVLQLGTAIFVYSDATHTRFAHSIGTLEASERIMFSCNENAESYGTVRMGPYARLLGRLAGLLHDLAQMPYAHTLQSEGHLYETEWKDTALREKLLGGDGFLQKKLTEFFKGANSEFVSLLRSDLTWIFVEGGDSKAAPPPRKSYLRYVADIVSNTLCADLIDYVQRDLLCVGFRDRVALRPLRFFLVKEVNGIPRLVLALWKPKTPDKMRHDVISEAIEFLRKRYSLGERVYFHHAKMAASAMLVKAVELSKLQCEQVWGYGDHTLLNHLESLKQETGAPHPSSTIIKSLLKRDLFKLAYELKHRAETEPGDPVAKVKQKYASGPNARANQRWLEENLALCLGIRDEDVIVYSPDPEMNLKEFKALVWAKRGEDPGPLMELPQAKHESEELMEKHRELWRLAVFARREALATTEDRDRIERFCRAILEVPEPDTQVLAEIYVTSHESEFVPGNRPWNERTEAVRLVRGILDGKPRGDFRFPRIADVLKMMQPAKT